MKLTRAQILEALGALSRGLAARGIQGEICLFGGTAMLLAFDARETTRDVDAVFEPPQLVREIAGNVARELGLPADWLNVGVKGFLSPKGDFIAENLPEFPKLRVTRPTTRYLLAMKCLASRVPGYDTDGDRTDILHPANELGIDAADQVLDIVAAYYPRERIPVKTQFFVREIMEEGSG